MDRQLHRLRRDELLEILLEVEQENEQLTDQNLELRQRLAKKEMTIRDAGSLAEASVQLSGVLVAAQEAADLYLQNTKQLCLEYARETEALCRTASRNGDGKSNESSLEARVLALFDDYPNQGVDAS